jgi:hypothetical protein
MLGGGNAALSSCAFVPLARALRRVPFDESALAGYDRAGSGTVSGQLVVTDQGQKHFGGGVPVTLIPVTAYTKEMVDRELGDGVYLTTSDGRFKKYVRKTTADHSGHFVFQQVPAGEYFVSGEASWSEPESPDDFVRQWACERIRVATGQALRIELSHNPQHGNSPVNNFWTLE